MKSNKLMMGILAGFAGGVLAGMLFAPEKGTDLRQNIMDKSDDYLDELKSKFDELYASLTEKFEGTKKDAEELVEKGMIDTDD